MDTRFSAHNSHLEGVDSFELLDPNLRRLGRQSLVYLSPLLKSFPTEPGIYTVTGGRQVGKTTLLKQWMARLLRTVSSPETIIYLSGELIDDHHSLVRIIGDILTETPSLRYLLIDEVTYIKQWDKAVKFLVDAGQLEYVTLMLTGSDMLILNEARMSFPGRRGKADQVDFHLYPLSFAETVQLKGVFDAEQQSALNQRSEPPSVHIMRSLFSAFAEYLMHGGFLTAINDLVGHGRILPATLRTYSDWVRGDMLKRGRHEHYLREIVTAIIKRYGSQITWNNLLADLSIDHPKTVADYVQLLAAMDAAFIQSALDMDRLTAAPKKAKKLLFTDPFIYHALFDWASDHSDGFALMQSTLADPVKSGQLAEACAVSHCRRFYPTFYIKAKGEVDIACVKGKQFMPIEVKWTTQLRPGQLAQISKYANGRIWTKNTVSNNINGLPATPLPLALYFIDLLGDS